MHRENGQDDIVQFVLRGSPEGVDEAIRVSSFGGSFSPGKGNLQPTLPEFDLSALSDVRSARETWKSPAGRTGERQIIRGSTSSGEAVAHVTAFEVY